MTRVTVIRSCEYGDLSLAPKDVLDLDPVAYAYLAPTGAIVATPGAVVTKRQYGGAGGEGDEAAMTSLSEAVIGTRFLRTDLSPALMYECFALPSSEASNWVTVAGSSGEERWDSPGTWDSRNTDENAFVPGVTTWRRASGISASGMGVPTVWNPTPPDSIPRWWVAQTTRVILKAFVNGVAATGVQYVPATPNAAYRIPRWLLRACSSFTLKVAGGKTGTTDIVDHVQPVLARSVDNAYANITPLRGWESNAILAADKSRAFEHEYQASDATTLLMMGDYARGGSWINAAGSDATGSIAIPDCETYDLYLALKLSMPAATPVDVPSLRTLILTLYP